MVIVIIVSHNRNLSLFAVASLPYIAPKSVSKKIKAIINSDVLTIVSQMKNKLKSNLMIIHDMD